MVEPVIGCVFEDIQYDDIQVEAVSSLFQRVGWFRVGVRAAELCWEDRLRAGVLIPSGRPEQNHEARRYCLSFQNQLLVNV